MQSEKIVVVNDNDECIGSMDKLLVHQNGILHRAFSIVLFDKHGSMLIQKRSKAKYHSPSLWANACCSHQRPGESLDESLHRRLSEELGVHGIALKEAFILRYNCTTTNSLIENEIDHVYYGKYDGWPINFCKDEIEQVKWVGLDFLKKTVPQSNDYTCWFKLIIERV